MWLETFHIYCVNKYLIVSVYNFNCHYLFFTDVGLRHITYDQTELESLELDHLPLLTDRALSDVQSKRLKKFTMINIPEISGSGAISVIITVMHFLLGKLSNYLLNLDFHV